MTRDQGIRLVSEQQAERELLADGFLKVRCSACDGLGYFQISPGEQWKKYSCVTCDGAGWTWQSPLAKTI